MPSGALRHCMFKAGLQIKACGRTVPRLAGRHQLRGQPERQGSVSSLPKTRATLGPAKAKRIIEPVVSGGGQ